MRSAAGFARRPWSALRGPNFRLYFAGQLISQSGMWMGRIGRLWLVLDLTGSAFALGALTALEFAPLLLLSLFSGALADRYPKRPLLIGLQVGALAQAVALVLLVFSGSVELWHVFVLAGWLGLVSAFDMPARQAFVSELVPREQVRSAVGLNSAVFNAARVVGPGLGGVIIAAWGLEWCFLVYALTYAAGMAALLLMRVELLRAAPRAGGPMRGAVRDGLRYVSREPDLALPLLLAALIGTFGMNFQVILPLLARYTFDVGAAGFGALNVAVGVGAVAGALGVAARATASSRMLVGVALVFGALLLAVGVAPHYFLALALLVALGSVSTTAMASTNASLQLTSAELYRGRVMSMFVLVARGTTPIGGALTGAIAGTWGVREAIVLNAILVLVGGLVGSGYLRIRRPARRGVDGAAPADLAAAETR